LVQVAGLALAVSISLWLACTCPPIHGIGSGRQADRLRPEAQGDPGQAPSRFRSVCGRQDIRYGNQMRSGSLLHHGLPPQAATVLPEGHAKPPCRHVRHLRRFVAGLVRARRMP
jgi:hypothetical protein